VAVCIDQHHPTGHIDPKLIFPLIKKRPWRDYSPQWQLVVKTGVVSHCKPPRIYDAAPICTRYRAAASRTGSVFNRTDGLGWLTPGRTSGKRVRPHSTSPFRLLRFPNQPRVLLAFGRVGLPAFARALTLPAAATRPLHGRPRGVETFPWRSDAVVRCRAHACLAWCCPAVHGAGAGVG